MARTEGRSEPRQPSEDMDDAERCRRAIEAAMGVALEHCSTEEEVRTQLASMAGVEPDADCEAALAEGINQETCSDSRGIRQWVFCRAEELMQTGDMNFSDAMTKSWDEAKDECSAIGHSI